MYVKRLPRDFDAFAILAAETLFKSYCFDAESISGTKGRWCAVIQRLQESHVLGVAAAS
jgi:hypothetical protein